MRERLEKTKSDDEVGNKPGTRSFSRSLERALQAHIKTTIPMAGCIYIEREREKGTARGSTQKRLEHIERIAPGRNLRSFVRVCVCTHERTHHHRSLDCVFGNCGPRPECIVHHLEAYKEEEEKIGWRRIKREEVKPRSSINGPGRNAPIVRVSVIKSLLCCLIPYVRYSENFYISRHFPIQSRYCRP